MAESSNRTTGTMYRRRRAFLSGAARMAVWALAVTIVWSGAAAGESGSQQIVVYKTPYCGCCTEWVEHLRRNGLEVNIESVQSTRPVQSRLGVPEVVRSCHTAQVGRYWVEGHVPADLVAWLLREQPPQIIGLAVPGMPVGSPGMEGANAKRYAVMQVDAEGEPSVLERRDGRNKP